LKIAIVTPYFRTQNAPKGGVGSHYAELVASLSPLVEEIAVIIPRDSIPAHVPADQLPKNVRLIRLRCGIGDGPLGRMLGRFFNMIFNIRVAWTLSRLQWSGRIDLVETTNYQYPCLLYSFCPGHAPIVTRVSTTTRQIRESNDDTAKGGLGLISRLERSMILRSAGVVTHTYRHAVLTAAELKIPSSRFHIIPHGIYIPPASPPLPSGNSVKVLFVGSLDRRKGADVLIESIPALLRRSQRLEFRIVGSDKGNFYQNSLAANLAGDDCDRVKFLGAIFQNDLESEYRNCHVVVCPSRYESFGLVFAEAMSFGRVPVGTTAGGIPEVVDHGITGILVEPGSTEALSRGIELLLAEEDAIPRLATSARKAAEDRFDRCLMARRTVNYYAEILQPRRDGPTKHELAA
jgi:glycosyltransferase involved in cell wall biosynthesis